MFGYVLLLTFLVCVSAYSPGEYDEDADYKKIVFGLRAETKRGSTSEVLCPKHYIMKQCDCKEKKYCAGSWIRTNTKEDACVVWTLNKDFGAAPKATCVRLWLTVESEIEKNPRAPCPPKFNRLGCNLWSNFRVQNHEKVAVSQRDGACTVYGDCGDECRVQAVCFRTGDV